MYALQIGARIQVRENDGVAGGAPQVRGRHARGRGRMAAVNVAPAHNMQNPPVVPAPAAQQARLDLNLNQNPAPPVPRPEIPVVTLNDSSNEDAPAAGIRFHNPFINCKIINQMIVKEIYNFIAKVV